MELQHKVEWAEVAIIGVYVLEATHIVVDASEHSRWAATFFLIAIVLGTAAAFLALRPHHPGGRFRWGWIVLLFVLLMIIGLAWNA
jgi:hypothetical protein